MDVYVIFFACIVFIVLTAAGNENTETEAACPDGYVCVAE